MEPDAWQQFREEFTKLQDKQVEQLQRELPILAALVTWRGGKGETRHSGYACKTIWRSGISFAMLMATRWSGPSYAP